MVRRPLAPTGRRLLIIGLDGVPPEFLFRRFRDVMPNVGRLVERGLRAPLRTTDPPVSVPAWPVMFTGVDPGTLGLYGFRHRRPGMYTSMYLPDSAHVKVPTFFDVLSDRGYRVAVIGVPLGYPPPSVNGAYISDFLTPAGATHYTHPQELQQEIESRFGPYTFDLVFRSGARDTVLSELTRMTRQRFDVAEWLYAREPWDVFALHEIGTDRLHHAFWKSFDPTHPEFEPGNPYERSARDYYALLDEGIGRLLRQAGEETLVLIVSDHGSMSMHGCFCINEWLAQKGYLALKQPPAQPGTPLDKLEVDWKRTTAWGEGGYYARIFFNVRGREPNGVVPSGQVAGLRQQLLHELGGIANPEGGTMPVRALDPREVYASVQGDPPDLMLYFDELRWRSAGTMGHPGLFLPHNDTGPDDAVHSFEGVFLLYDPRRPLGRDHATYQIRDMTPTLLALLGERSPAHIQGVAMPGAVPREVELPAARDYLARKASVEIPAGS